MSLVTSAVAAAAPTTGRRGPGRHRLDRPAGVRCSDLPGVRERLADRPARTSLLQRVLGPTTPAGRHTWDFLTSVGGRPRTAFAIILSL
ncbi:hypothetical protein GB931_15035 [Modestobacter sp. I12A-02628]|uniref:Uncharacterized protein n=1 Tax=Goekera deserti TaxID=2497753 RepID=A0A7K3WAH5_9ACTN|nr:hypothetical protein [Goekera deserti]MPQ99208.1 hypothetical protein [Goekera deserti]NDI47543.1 hypothetical protein [Goekera deserti]NEL53354.1 hypothetical protein [Goekera deserti]